MRSKFNRLYKPELDFLLDNCNFSEDESILLNMASAGKSDIQMAEKLSVSASTITKRKKAVYKKIIGFLEEMEDMTTIYVNGKRVTKEDLSKIEIKTKSIKRIISEKLMDTEKLTDKK